MPQWFGKDTAPFAAPFSSAPIERSDQSAKTTTVDSDLEPISEATTDCPELKVDTFGRFRLTIRGEDFTECANAKGKQLLKFLLTHRQRVSPKEELMELLWPGHDSVSARNNLNVLVYGFVGSLALA